MKRKTSTTRFLNVDLDLYSRSDLQPLVDAFGKKVITLYVGRERKRYSAHLELARYHKLSADSIIRGFCTLIRALSKTERALWDCAQSREFSIGVQAGHRPFVCDFRIEALTLKAVARLGGVIVLTVYGPEKAKRTKSVH